MKQQKLDEITENFWNEYVDGKIGIIEGVNNPAILSSVTNSKTCPDYILEICAIKHPALVVEYIQTKMLVGRAYKKPIQRRKFPQTYEGINVHYLKTESQE